VDAINISTKNSHKIHVFFYQTRVYHVIQTRDLSRDFAPNAHGDITPDISRDFLVKFTFTFLVNNS